MKHLAASAALLLAGCAAGTWSSSPDAEARRWDGLPRLGPIQVALLYHRVSGIPAPASALARAEPLGCAPRDDRDRTAPGSGAAGQLRADEAAVAGTRRWLLPLRRTLGAYDMVLGGFPTGLRDGAVVAFAGPDYCGEPLDYRVALTNGGAFGLLPIDAGAAVRLIRDSPSREVEQDLEVEVTGAQPVGGRPVLLARIRRLRSRDAATGAILSSTEGDPRLRSRALTPP